MSEYSRVKPSSTIDLRFRKSCLLQSS